jgi:hypothetical protein
LTEVRAHILLSLPENWLKLFWNGYCIQHIAFSPLCRRSHDYQITCLHRIYTLIFNQRYSLGASHL